MTGERSISNGWGIAPFYFETELITIPQPRGCDAMARSVTRDSCNIRTCGGGESRRTQCMVTDVLERHIRPTTSTIIRTGTTTWRFNAALDSLFYGDKISWLRDTHVTHTSDDAARLSRLSDGARRKGFHSSPEAETQSGTSK